MKLCRHSTRVSEKPRCQTSPQWPHSFFNRKSIASRSCHHQGLKPHSFRGSARLKPCPDTNQIITSCIRKCRNSSRRLSAGLRGSKTRVCPKEPSEKAAAGKIACPTKLAELRPHYTRWGGRPRPRANPWSRRIIHSRLQ